MRLSTEWISEGANASAEERATLCNLQICSSMDENACFHFDPGSKTAFKHITVPAVHFAEGLATDWWSIFGGRDREHPILHYRTGFALPDLSFKCDGSTLEVTGSQLSFSNPRCASGRPARNCSRDGAESTLAGFIDRVVDQLACQGVANSEEAVRWPRVSDSRSDPDERAICGPPVPWESIPPILLQRRPLLLSVSSLIQCSSWLCRWRFQSHSSASSSPGTKVASKRISGRPVGCPSASRQ